MLKWLDSVYHGIDWHRVEMKLDMRANAEAVARMYPDRLTVDWRDGYPVLREIPEEEPDRISAAGYINCLHWGVDEGAFRNVSL